MAGKDRFIYVNSYPNCSSDICRMYPYISNQYPCDYLWQISD